MDPLAVLADVYVRRLSSAQYGDRYARAHGVLDAAAGTDGADRSRVRKAARAFRRVATALLG